MALSGCSFFEALSEARQAALAEPLFIATEGSAQTDRVAVWHVTPQDTIVNRWQSNFAFAGSAGGLINAVRPSPDLIHLGVGGQLLVGDPGSSDCDIDDCAMRIHDMASGQVVFETTDNGLRDPATALCNLGVPPELDEALDDFVAAEAALVGAPPEDHPFAAFEVTRLIDGQDEAMAFLGWTSGGAAVVDYSREDQFQVVDEDGQATGFWTELGLDTPFVSVAAYLLLTASSGSFAATTCLDDQPMLDAGPPALPAPDIAPEVPSDLSARTGLTVNGQPAVLWPLDPAIHPAFLYPTGTSAMDVIGPFAHSLPPS